MLERIAVKEVGQHSRIIDAGELVIADVATLAAGRRVFSCLVDGVPQHLEWLGLRDHPEGVTPYLNAGVSE